MSWAGNILRVDLGAGTCVSEPLRRDWAEQYLGQRGLATKYFSEEVDAAIDPYDPGNKLIFASGPLTGTMSATGGRYAVVTKGALTGAIACSNSGGKFGAEFKRAGWDMIIFEGRAPSPVYLHIQDGEAALLPADDLWGKSVWDTEAAIHEAAACAVLYNAGEYESKAAGRAWTYAWKTCRPSGGRSHGHYFYTQLYMSQATWQKGDKYWNKYFPDIQRHLLSTQQGNGSWRGDHVGLVYGSAIGLLILQIPYNKLPILSR